MENTLTLQVTLDLDRVKLPLNGAMLVEGYIQFLHNCLHNNVITGMEHKAYIDDAKALKAKYQSEGAQQ